MPYALKDIDKLIRERSDGLLRKEKTGGQRFRKLVVLVHGYQSAPSYLHHLVLEIFNSPGMDDAQILLFSYDASRFSRERLWHATYRLYRRLNELLASTSEGDIRYRQIEEIILIGHSVGALIVRKLYVFARGEGEPPLNDPAAKPRAAEWPCKVSRLILLAGMMRGWDLTQRPPYMARRRWYLYRLLIFYARFWALPLLVFDAEKGSAFVSDLRLQWYRLTRASQQHHIAMPKVIQLLGQYDDFVHDADHKDVQVGDFVLKHVEGSGHYDIISFDPPKTRSIWKRINNPKLYQETGWENRARLFGAALNAHDLTTDLEPSHRITPSMTVQHLIVLLHGIRDTGEWGESISRIGEQRDRASLDPPLREGEDYDQRRRFKCLNASYQRLSMLEFLFSVDRRRAARCLMDAYTECRFLYSNPNLQIHFVGHSNGTYGLGEALKSYWECKFVRLVLAGSVLPYEYEWHQRYREGRFTALKNYIAKDDAIVALLPKGLALTRWPWVKKDIGGGGFDGFQDDVAKHEPVFLNGGHSAVTHRKQGDVADIHNSMLDFLLNGTHTSVPDAMTKREPSARLRVASDLSWLLWYLAPPVLPLLGWLSVKLWAWLDLWPYGVWSMWWLVPVLLYILLLRKVFLTI